MKTEFAALTSLICLMAGLGLGWQMRGLQRAPAVRSSPSTETRVSEETSSHKTALFPERPKPLVASPSPILDRPTPTTALQGSLPALSSPLPAAEIGSSAPLIPNLPHGTPPVADLNADEALVRKVCLQAGAEIVSTSDARDSSGTIGRSIVAETLPSLRDELRNALRRAVGERAVISDAGAGSVGEDPGFKKMEDDLAALRKRRDQARIDFLPQSPTLRDLEEEVLKMERTVRERRLASTHVRLNVLLRPTL